MANKKYYDSPFSLAIKTNWLLYEAMVKRNQAKTKLDALESDSGKVIKAGKQPPQSLVNDIAVARQNYESALAQFESFPQAVRDEWEDKVLKSMELWCYKMASRWKIFRGATTSHDDVFQEARYGCICAVRRLETLEMNQAYSYVDCYCNGYAGKCISKNEKTHKNEVYGDQPLEGDEGEGRTVFSTIEGTNTVDDESSRQDTEMLIAALKKHIETDLTADERILVSTLFDMESGLTLKKGEKRTVHTVAQHLGITKYMAKELYESAITKLRMAMLDICGEDEADRIMSAIA